MAARMMALAYAGIVSIFPVFSPAHAADGPVVTRAMMPSPRPVARPGEVALPVVPVVANTGFARWISGFRSRAMAQGISARTFDRAFQGVEYNADVISRDRNQAEFARTLWDYLDSAVSDTRVANGRAGLASYGPVLDRIEAKYGVDKEVVVAIWGLESAYGSYRGSTPIVPALATLAYDGRRGPFFEEQLVAALRIIQAGDIDPAHMTGSWAGAMGHTQFMPTSFLEYAVDFTGDGRRDIWSDDPSDALASTAAYLARFGWIRDQPWGVEVQLPAGFDFAHAGHDTKRPVADWTALGVRGMDGRPVADHGKAAVLVPAGANGPAFMVFRNFNVIERYNAADSYVIGVGHLSDRLKGQGGFVQDWPRGDRALMSAEKKELQTRLTAAGYSTQGVDGRIGPNTIDAIRAYQIARGLTPDGYPSAALLEHLR
ncbi:lytic murein transglycosylase [Mangrovicoccus sp. HB161399]|uniref:lytic murein transglycosylase n=1 Tax=Mangrovicoccus sp. HB161399 TaxID=2720392 RepID=UPI001553ABC6|nr:lytic murein transglycosylase [Mangrovicoccus sp. HB161399]